MNPMKDTFIHLRDLYRSSPIMAVSLIAAAVAFASTPLAFALMGRMKWFNARRGRTLLRPAFWSVVCSMILVMTIPAFILALLVKSEHFDENRYAFDPNRTISPIDQGRQYEARTLLDSVQKLDEGVRAEQERLAAIRKDLVDSVKKLDTAMLALRESARQAPAVIPPMNEVLERMGGIRKAVGLDAPQQVTNLKYDPTAMTANAPGTTSPIAASPVPQPTAPVAVATNGLSRPEIDAILATVPEPQKPLAVMLPLSDLPPGWVMSKIPGKAASPYVETFNAENLYEKMDGRAESFIQNGVKGMACCSYHPKGNEESEIQLFVFEMGNSLKARGKFDSEKPDEAKPTAIGEGAYTAAGSVFVHADKYYTIVNVAQDEPKLAEFALDLAKRVAALQKSTKSSGPTAQDLFNLFPAEPKRSGTKYVAQDVFGYSFLSDVFIADYKSGDVEFQGFLRPYASAEEAKKVFETYVDTARKDGAVLKTIDDSKADKMVMSSNIGMFDVIFLKGNAVGGSNGASDAKPAEALAREFAKSLPANVPVIEPDKKSVPAEGGADAEKQEK
ncbi:MAG: hypothetical protein JWN86_2156 [Planctomycetota bacterium]|nr:hypothetical protein [Planctomycetota bacterium]